MKNNQSVTLERIFDAPPEKIWQALSDNSQMKRWYFDLPDFRPEVGFQFQFKGGPAPERQYTHLCEVVEVIAGQKIAYTWRYEGYAGDSLVTFEIVPRSDGQTLLRLSHTGLETFPQDNEDLATKNFEEGWNHILNISLKKYLENRNR